MMSRDATRCGLRLVAVLLLASAPALAGEHEAGESPVVAPGAKVEKLADGFQFTEGPACHRGQGDVYFTDIPNNRIHRWSQGELSTYVEDSGGANGLIFDRAGNLLICEGGNRRVTRLSSGKQQSVVADAYDGKKLNSPNDLWVHMSGGVYFTDPRYGDESDVEQDGYHVYYVASRSSDVKRVIDDLEKPNGVIGTRHPYRLFVADAGAGKTYVYDIERDGSLSNRKLFAPQGSDGLALDERGNLYLTDEGISVYNPAGEKIAAIEVPERPSNMTFCGEDRKTLFITARTGLYAVKMNVAGM